MNFDLAVEHMVIISDITSEELGTLPCITRLTTNLGRDLLVVDENLGTLRVHRGILTLIKRELKPDGILSLLTSSEY